MTTQRQLDAIIRELEPDLRQALLDAFDGIRNDIDMTALRNAVERGDVGAVEDILEGDESWFSPYALAATTIFLRYGAAFAPTIETKLRFNAINAMPALQEIITQNVNRMTEETRQMARDMIVQGLGRRETAKRIRDSVGLTRPQAGFVQSMRERLESNDPTQLRAILKGQTLRDKRYDRTIKKAIATGQPIPAGQIEAMTEAYMRKLIRKRAEDVAQAEAMQYAEASKFEAAKQVDGEVSKEWMHSRIWLRARPDHVMMNGEKVIGIKNPFIMPDGTAMQHAHDPAGGAKHNASCRCRTRYRKVRDG